MNKGFKVFILIFIAIMIAGFTLIIFLKNENVYEEQSDNQDVTTELSDDIINKELSADYIQEDITATEQNDTYLDQTTLNEQDTTIQQSSDGYPTTAELVSNKNGEELHAVIEAADNENKFNPRITGANLFKPGDYDFYAISSAVMEWMYKMGINDSCVEIKVVEAGTRGTENYKLELIFDKSEAATVEMISYGEEYYIQTFVDDSDVGFEGEP